MRMTVDSDTRKVIDRLKAELAATIAERNRAQRACEQMGERISALEVALEAASKAVLKSEGDYQCP